MDPGPESNSSVSLLSELLVADAIHSGQSTDASEELSMAPSGPNDISGTEPEDLAAAAAAEAAAAAAAAAAVAFRAETEPAAALRPLAVPLVEPFVAPFSPLPLPLPLPLPARATSSAARLLGLMLVSLPLIRALLMGTARGAAAPPRGCCADSRAEGARLSGVAGDSWATRAAAAEALANTGDW